MDPDGFDAFTALLDYPVYLVTTASHGERAGCLVGFAGQCSIDPPRFTAWISRTNRTHRIAAEAEFAAVHLVADRRLAELFGARTGDEVDKFADVPWTPGPGGVPVLGGAPAWFVGRILDRAVWGDHTAHLLEPTDAHRSPGRHRVLSLRDVSTLDPGHPA
ncbi:flavin reductase family protein [Kitasatospora cinereorecta]|uniref:Flavin reductase family protein n=1 Tax=Kitasatospora cinereorecta TaxID=285560 RepID=A0ABW0VB56_9ACTN